MKLIKICTINVPEKYIEDIKGLIGKNNLYPSRSELIRVATREFLIREFEKIERRKRHPELFEPEPEPEIPYNVIKKLEDPNGNDKTKKDFKHEKPSELIRYTKDFTIDLILSLIKDHPDISNEKLAKLSGYNYYTVRSQILKAIKVYNIPVQTRIKSIPRSHGKLWFYTLE